MWNIFTFRVYYFWSKNISHTEKRFFCLVPGTGIPNATTTSTSIIVLGPTYVTNIWITRFTALGFRSALDWPNVRPK